MCVSCVSHGCLMCVSSVSDVCLKKSKMQKTQHWFGSHTCDRRETYERGIFLIVCAGLLFYSKQCEEWALHCHVSMTSESEHYRNPSYQTCKFSKARVGLVVGWQLSLSLNGGWPLDGNWACRCMAIHPGPRKLASLLSVVDKKCKTDITITELEALIIKAVHLRSE